MSKFSEYTTSSAFRIDLSKRMIEFLFDSQNGKFDNTDYGHWYTTGGSLIRRGLVKHIQGTGYVLTDAGRAIIPLLKLAGFKEEKKAA